MKTETAGKTSKGGGLQGTVKEEEYIKIQG